MILLQSPRLKPVLWITWCHVNLLGHSLQQEKIDINLHRSMCTVTLLNFLLLTKSFLSGIVCQNIWYLHAKLFFLKLKTLSGGAKSACMTNPLEKSGIKLFKTRITLIKNALTPIVKCFVHLMTLHT